MRKAVQIAVIGAFIVLAGTLGASEKFDGKWQTTLTCPAKGQTEGYTWKFVGEIQNGVYKGERGTVDQPGYLLLQGPVADDGSAKLTANGIIASREYARGVFAHKGESYSYNVKAHFDDSKGSGARDEGLGIVGRPCTFDFVKQ
jgi:hypothetical protein